MSWFVEHLPPIPVEFGILESDDVSSEDNFEQLEEIPLEHIPSGGIADGSTPITRNYSRE